MIFSLIRYHQPLIDTQLHYSDVPLNSLTNSLLLNVTLALIGVGPAGRGRPCCHNGPMSNDASA
jgi:hypothetical protein